jgi:hypothetical protein
MNCCNHDCNQGRDCPARVAKAKPVMRAADPLPPSIWRYQLRRLGYWMLMGILGMLLLSFLVACAAVYA